MTAYRDVTGRYRTPPAKTNSGKVTAPVFGTAVLGWASGCLGRFFGQHACRQHACHHQALVASEVSQRRSLLWLGTWRFLFLAVSCGSFLNFSGCQTDQTAQVKINQMRAELLAIEGRYAALRHDYEKVRRRLAAQGDPLTDGAAQPSALPLVYPPGDTPLDQMPSSEIWSDPMDPQQVSPIPGMTLPGDEAPADSAPSVLENVAYNRSVNRNDSPLPLAPPRSRPVQLLVDPQQSGGVNRDHQPGDEGVRIVVQPLDASGRLVLHASDFELRLLDYSRDGDSELGHWRFSKTMIQKFLQSRAQTNGIPLQVSLRNRILGTTELLAEVRMLLPDGQTLEHRELIQVRAGNSLARGPAGDRLFDGVSFPKGTAGLADFGSATQTPHEPIIPSYLPAAPGSETVASPSSAPPTSGASLTGSRSAAPGWAPIRQ